VAESRRCAGASARASPGGDQQGAQFAVAPLAHPAGWIEVNPKLALDPGSVAAASGTDREVGRYRGRTTALCHRRSCARPLSWSASPRHSTATSPTAWPASVLKGEEANRSMDTTPAGHEGPHDMRESLSGGTWTRSFSTMITYQNGYAAIARFVTTFDGLSEHHHQQDGRFKDGI